MCPKLKRCEENLERMLISPVDINDKAAEYVLQYKNLYTLIHDMFYVKDQISACTVIIIFLCFSGA